MLNTDFWLKSWLDNRWLLKVSWYLLRDRVTHNIIILRVDCKILISLLKTNYSHLWFLYKSALRIYFFRSNGEIVKLENDVIDVIEL